ncbi:MAG TPA: class I SAM-dependent methyltransferase [Gammaproteobacteria bacterium]
MTTARSDRSVSDRSRRRYIETVRRDYARLADDYERRWHTFNAVVREWVLARWPDGLTANARVLDLGCGTGAFLAAIAARDPELELVGLDLTPALLAEARRRVPSARLIEGDAEAPPFNDGTFDVVCSLNVLHHLHDRPGHVAVLARLCRPGGTMFLCTFAGGRSLGMRAVDLWLEWRHPGWRGMVSPAEVERMLARDGHVEVRDRGERAAGFWRLQLFRLERRP